MSSSTVSSIGGKYVHIYESFYSQLDPRNIGRVGAMEAATFLKKSGLRDVDLGKIWDIADKGSKGYLTKQEFFVALKLVALVQFGKEISPNFLSLDVPPPNMGDALRSPSAPLIGNGSIQTGIPQPVVPATSWTMKPHEKAKYDQLFQTVGPVNGVIPGNKVKGLLMDSKLPVDTLGRIWDLADMDKDGALNQHEFCVAMHLVYKALEKNAIPSVLPIELLPPEKRKSSIPDSSRAIPVLPAVPSVPMQVAPQIVPSMPQTVPPMPQIPTAHSTPKAPNVTAVSNFTTTPTLASSPTTVAKTPLSSDTLSAFSCDIPWIIGNEEKSRYDVIFSQADQDKDGYVSGNEIRNVFLHTGIPQPVLARIWGLCDTAEEGKLNSEQFALAMWLIGRKLKGIEPPVKLIPEMIPLSCRPKGPQEFVPQMTPELEALAKEVEGLRREKLELETDINQKESDIRMKNNEILSLQGELDALALTLKQLESQKSEAQKRLNDLRLQREVVDSKVNALRMEIDAEQIKVDKLKQQAEQQEVAIKSQEDELNSRKKILEELKAEEERAAKRHAEITRRLDEMGHTSKESSTQIDEIRNKLDELSAFQNRLQEAIQNLDSVLNSGDISGLRETDLHLQPDFKNDSIYRFLNGLQDKSNSSSGSFKSSDEKDGDSNQYSSSEHFLANDQFSASNKPTDDGFHSDPFASTTNSNDPFASSNSNTSIDDAFGCDPFAVLHAPPKAGSVGPTISRSQSPSPALPPKKGKEPPPRPAPPRPAPPAIASQSGFADFDAFDAKTSATGLVATEEQNGRIYSEPAYSFHDYVDPFAEPTHRYEEPQHRYDEPAVDEFDAKFESFSSSFDPFNPSTDPFSQSTKSADPFSLSVADPFNQSDSSAQPFNQSKTPADPFQKKTTVADPFSQSAPIADPFNPSTPVADPFKPSTPVADPFNTPTSAVFNSSDKSGSVKDPFALYDTPDPFNEDPFLAKSCKPVPTQNGDANWSPPELAAIPSEDQQLAWATAESLRLEEERKKRVEEEKAETKLALKLSKSEGGKKSFIRKVLK